MSQMFLRALTFCSLVLLLLSPGIIAQVRADAVSDAASASKYLSEQKAALGKLYSTGANTKACVNILSGRAENAALTAPTNYLAWAQIFNISFWIPVVPEQCVVCYDTAIGKYTDTVANDHKAGDYKPGISKDVCPYGNGQSVPLPLNLIPQVIIRLYGLLASITIYALALVFSIIGIRYLIGGLSKGGRYTDTAKNLRDVFSAMIITLTISTVFLQILYGVLQVDKTQFKIDIVCIPPQYVFTEKDARGDPKLDAKGQIIQSCKNP
jgi:hypothetical protein